MKKRPQCGLLDIFEMRLREYDNARNGGRNMKKIDWRRSVEEEFRSGLFPLFLLVSPVRGLGVAADIDRTSRRISLAGKIPVARLGYSGRKGAGGLNRPR